MAKQQGAVPTDAKKPAVLAAMLLVVLVTAALYFQVKDHQLVSYDDDEYVAKNEFVQGGLTPRDIVWAFGIHGPGQWHPLTWLTHQLDHELYGQYAGGYLLTNVAFHLANVWSCCFWC